MRQSSPDSFQELTIDFVRLPSFAVPAEEGGKERREGRREGGKVADCECCGLFLLSDFPEVHIVMEILGAAQSAGGGPAVLIPDNIMYAGISIYILCPGI